MTHALIRPDPPALRTADLSIVARDLRRTFRKRKGWFRSGEVVEAVRGISLDIPRGTIFGMVGPNGAGKTTTIKMLSTLLIPTAGRATVEGFDVVGDERAVRRRLGVLFGGDKGLYNQMSGRENLRYFGRLYGMDDRAIRQRSEALLERVQLTDRAAERVESYSRGMKQRLHIAKTLLHAPAVAILDEPTIGLDPAAAIEVRQLIADLVPAHTVLLTTHDMHEADLLCRELAIIDRGVIVASGSPADLKATATAERRVVITLAERSDGLMSTVSDRIRGLPAVARVHHDPHAADTLTLQCGDSTAALDQALAVLRDVGADVRAVDVREPSLEDVFLRVTGRDFEEEA